MCRILISWKNVENFDERLEECAVDKRLEECAEF